MSNKERTPVGVDEADAPAPSAPEPPATRALVKSIASLSLPLALHNVGHSLLGIVDSAFVGRLGAAELAAVSLGNLLLFTVLVLGMGIVFGTEPLVAQALGAERPGKAKGAVRTGIGLSLAMTPVVWGSLLVIPKLLPLANVDADVIEHTATYLLGRAPGVPFVLGFTALRAYLQGYERTRSIVVGMVLANLLNVPADLVLIFGDEGLAGVGLGGIGFAGIGVLGAGIASSIAAAVQMLVVVWPTWALWQEHPPTHDDDRVSLASVLRLGVPVGLQYQAEVGIFAAVGVAMGSIGAIELAAHQIALALASVSFRVIMGISTATSVVVGKQVGARQHPPTQTPGLAGLGLGAMVMAMAGGIFLLIPDLLARLFTPETAVVAAAIPLLKIAAIFQLSDGLQGVAGGALRGAGDPTWAFLVNVAAYWAIAFPFGLWLAFSAGWEGPGLWWGLTLGLTVAAVGQVGRFVWRARQGYEPAAS